MLLKGVMMAHVEAVQETPSRAEVSIAPSSGSAESVYGCDQLWGGEEPGLANGVPKLSDCNSGIL